MTTISLLPARNGLTMLRWKAAAALGLIVCGCSALAQTPGDAAEDATAVPETEYPQTINEIAMPGSVSETVRTSFAQQGSIFP